MSLFRKLSLAAVLLFIAALLFWKNYPRWVANQITSTFENHFDELSDEKRGHFMIRLYRMSGNKKYAPEIRTYADRLSERFKIHARNLESPDYVQKTVAHFLELPQKPLLKHRYRVKIRSQWPEMVFAHRLLFLAFQLKSFGLDQGPLQPDFERVLAYLRSLPYQEYLSNEGVIRYNSAQVVNMVYQLKFLGLGDYEDVFTRQFKNVFFSQSDKSLNRTLYLNKIYGLTHFIISASDFYQHPVPAEKFEWILIYFSENLETILLRNTPDTAAEIAVCFKLTKQATHPAIKRIQTYLLQKFDPLRGYLPSDHHSPFTSDSMEHRNILTIMALRDDWQPVPGPDLNHFAK